MNINLYAENSLCLIFLDELIPQTTLPPTTTTTPTTTVQTTELEARPSGRGPTSALDGSGKKRFTGTYQSLFLFI